MLPNKNISRVAPIVILGSKLNLKIICQKKNVKKNFLSKNIIFFQKYEQYLIIQSILISKLILFDICLETFWILQKSESILDVFLLMTRCQRTSIGPLAWWYPSRLSRVRTGFDPSYHRTFFFYFRILLFFL